MSDVKKFGPTLRRLRTTAGMTMGELARALRISVPYLSDIERGNRNPPKSEQVQKIAELLKVPAGDLVALAKKTRLQLALEARSLPDDRYELGAALMRSIDTLSDEQLRRFKALLDDSNSEAE